MLQNIIAVAVILAVIGGAVFYIISEKKKGKKCIGCKYSGTCSKAKNGGCTDKKQ